MKRILHRLNKRERVYTVVALTAVFVSLGYRVVVMPFWQRSQALSERIVKTRDRLDRYVKLVSREDALRKRFATIFAAGGSAVAGDEGTLAMAVVQSIAADAGVGIVDIRPQGKVREYDVYTERLLSVRTQADLPAYIRFIYNLEHSPALLAIKKMALAVKAKESVIDGSFTVSQVQVREQ